MNVFDEYSRNVLIELNKYDVEYLIIGGYAVNYHGYNRTTGDVDLWVKPDNLNKEKMILAFRELEIEEPVLNDVRKMNFEELIVFSDGEKPYKIDFITRVYGVEFDDAWSNKILFETDGITVPFINLHHLVITKFNTGRPQDKIDIEELQKIQEIKNRK